MCIVNERLKQLYLDNAPGLIGWFIKRYKETGIYFDSFEDMKQELLLNLWEKLPLYDETKGKFSTFVIMVCKSRVTHKRSFVTTQKRKGTIKTLSLDYSMGERLTLMDIIGSNEDPCEALCRKEERENLTKRLDPETYAYYIDGFSIKEIAGYQGITESATRDRIERNISRVKREIKKEKDDEPNKFI